MFDALLGRKFYHKCKTNLKLIKIRMEKISKRRKSVQKFFKADIADLLKNNLDINAYGRAEGLLVEINMTSCYNMIEKFCECIYANLSTIDKETECPDACREAVASLMYATARFSDLPELRDLRNLFSTKYGNSLDVYVSKELVEKLKLTPPTKEMKFQLLQEIANEASIAWDSKALEQKLYTPPPANHNQRKYGSLNEEDDTDDTYRKKELKDDSSNRKKKEEIVVNDPIVPSLIKFEPERKIACPNGRVPPPPYYTKRAEATPPTSSDSETAKSEKPKPKSVRRNRFNKTPSIEHEGSYPDAHMKSDVSDKAIPKLLPPPYLRSYGDSTETGRSLERGGKHTRRQSLPEELSPRTMHHPNRAASLEPDGMMGHIHPKLPDYDDLASRIASLTGR